MNRIARIAASLAFVTAVASLGVFALPSAQAVTSAATTPVTSSGDPVIPPPGYYSILLNGEPVSNAYQPITNVADGYLTIPVPTTNPPGNGKANQLSMYSMVTSPSSENAAIFPPGPKGKLRLVMNQTTGGVGNYLQSLKPNTALVINVGPAKVGAIMTQVYSESTVGGGTFEFQVPNTLSAGTSIMSYVGILNDDTVLNLVLGVDVRGENAAIITYPQSRTTFAAGSAKLTSSAKSKLNAYLNDADRAHPLTAMVKTWYAKGGKALAKQRGAKIKTYLENNGITGGVMIQTLHGKRANVAVTQLAMDQG